MVTLKDFKDEPYQNREYQMEMMVVLGGLMAMMGISLALQYSSFKKIQVTVNK